MKHNYAAYCLAIKDDFCLEETITELMRQSVGRVLIVSPASYWTDDSNQSDDDLANLMGIAKRTGADLRCAKLKSTADQNTALYTEAMYRNYAVDQLACDPRVDYILTVDADELWFPGTLDHIDSMAVPGVDRIDLPAIPVMGVPGLPVEGATDSMLVATARRVHFTWGRAVRTDAVTQKGIKPALHFSATRRTIGEVVDKMRKSAHYDDPTYDFEGWIKHTLPNVRVGLKNAHMYKSTDNIWPVLRAWTDAELACIPMTLHPYLSK